MSNRQAISPTPWDSAVFGIPTYELLDSEEQTLAAAAEQPGHYTVRIDPLSNREPLHRHGFYYCDTLIEPYVTHERYLPQPHADITMAPAEAQDILPMCDRNFLFGRFHRDFNLDAQLADARYRQWLEQLLDRHEVFSFHFKGVAIGFAAAKENALVLHAMAREFQGKGLARHCWTLICDHLFAQGHREITSSVSAANLAVINLYTSLGFRFRNAKEIYHCLIR